MKKLGFISDSISHRYITASQASDSQESGGDGSEIWSL